MNAVELFAGAGGASLGILAAGFTEVRAVEWNHEACETRRAAGLRCDEGDVRDPVHYEGVSADLLWSSFPCQAWSTAGKRLGKDDPRNGWPWTVGVLDQVRPRWFIGENVAGLTHHRGGCERGRCTDDCARLYLEGTILRQLGERFAWAGWRVLDCARYGVPQNRERLILVAGPRPIEWPRETHAPPEELRTVGLFGDGRKPWRTVREALNLSGALRPERGAGMCERHGERPDHSVDEPAPTIGAGSAGSGPRLRVVGIPVDEPSPTIRAQASRDHTGHRGGHAAPLIEDPKHPHVRPEAPAPTIRSGGSGNSSPPMWLRTGNQTLLGNRDRTEPYERDVDEPAPTVRVTMPHELVTRAASRPELLDRPSPTVTTCEVKGTRGEGQHGGPDRASDAAWLGAGIRRLTPAECAILQDFPADHPWRGAKTSIYAQIGNAVPPTLARVMCEAVAKADASR